MPRQSGGTPQDRRENPASEESEGSAQRNSPRSHVYPRAGECGDFFANSARWPAHLRIPHRTQVGLMLRAFPILLLAGLVATAQTKPAPEQKKRDLYVEGTRPAT